LNQKPYTKNEKPYTVGGCAQHDDNSINSTIYGNENHQRKREVGRVGFEPTTPVMSRLIIVERNYHYFFWKEQQYNLSFGLASNHI
jgi:hypothetical protein